MRLDPATQQHYCTLAEWLAQRVRGRHCPVIGINGAQGSGKTTLAHWLVDALRQQNGLRALVLSLDDFYLPRAQRRALAASTHPLLATRGVPGTHEVALGIEVIARLRRLGSGERLRLPAFSKAADDRRPPADAAEVAGPFDLLLFEGWCVGTPPQADEALATPVNGLEAKDDADGRWRRHVNAQLAGPYADWFSALDACVFLQVPDFDSVRRWRWQQECALQEDGPGRMDEAALARFLMHYERLTRHALAVMPERADAVLTLDGEHAVGALRLR